jgi:hypothetical protein
MKLIATVLSLSLAPLCISAQTAALKNAATPVAPWSKVSGCPVSLRAEQISSANMMQARKTQQDQPQQSGQRLHLTLESRDSRQITAATVEVHGFTPPPSPMNALNAVFQRGPGSGLASRTIQIAFAPQASAAVGADILVPGVSAIQTIDLVSLAYADGAGWKPAGGQSCQITPDPLMLISATNR